MKEQKNLPVKKRQKHRHCLVKLNLFLSSIFLIGCLSIIFSVVSNTVQGETFPNNNIETILDDSIIAVDNFQNNTASEEIENSSIPWYLTLVNDQNPLPENYMDYMINLVDIPGGEKVDERIYDPLMEMLDAAKELGPIVVSGYRTQNKQQSLYDKKIKEFKKQGYSETEAIKLTQQWVAEPGTSEHQLGLAVDINGATYDIYLWLQENSYKYGFIFRYPGNKTDLTGVAEEVWHYRYVGKEAAKEIHERGICLEEYLENSQFQTSSVQNQQEQISLEHSTQIETSWEEYKLHEGEWIPVVPSLP